MTECTPNPDLEVGPGNKQRWNQPSHRRHGFHNAHTLFRFAQSSRSGTVWPLRNTPDSAMAAASGVRTLVGLETFSALVVAREDAILLEAYAPDFGPRQPHSIQSITKMHINLIIGRLVADGVLDLAQTVAHYLPNIGSGYAGATLQMLLDMNIANDFSEDYEDPACDAFAYETSLGWRLPAPGQADLVLRTYLPTISGCAGKTDEVDYKSANTDVLAWIADEVTGGGLHSLLQDIVEAAGYEGAFHISTDRDGFPAFSGGGCLTARDLARFGLLFAGGGLGAGGNQVGDAGFIGSALTRPLLRFASPREWIGYSNHLFTDGRWIGHAGYGGQFLLVDLTTRTVCAFFSVLENESGYEEDYMLNVIRTLQELASR